MLFQANKVDIRQIVGDLQCAPPRAFGHPSSGRRGANLPVLTILGG